MAFVQGTDKMVQLTYTFIFNRKDNIWNHVYEFEHDLDDFFKSKNLEAELINFINGSSGNKTLYIKDISKEMELRNDKKLDQKQGVMKAPEKSYTATKKLVSHINTSYNKTGSK